MAEAAAQDDDDIFVYMGGDQQVPLGVRRARIHISVKIVRARAFQGRHQLISVDFHDGVEMIEEQAFDGCGLLRSIKLLGVKIVKRMAFLCCFGLTDIEFGDKLETIENSAFNKTALRKVKMPSVRTIGQWAFAWCRELSDVECGEALETLEQYSLIGCSKLKRIVLPLKSGLIGGGAFDNCHKLMEVDLVGGIHQTVASLHMESWRNEMTDEINRINQVLPNTYKTEAIQQWMESTVQLLDERKDEHRKVLKEATTLLELALWKTNLDDDGGDRLDREGVRITRGSRKKARKETYVTSGANVVIKNVLPFLQLLE